MVEASVYVLDCSLALAGQEGLKNVDAVIRRQKGDAVIDRAGTAHASDNRPLAIASAVGSRNSTIGGGLLLSY